MRKQDNTQMEKEIKAAKTDLDACRSATTMGHAQTSSAQERELPRTITRQVLPSNICMCVFMYVCVYMYIGIYVYVCRYMCMYVGVCVCVCMYVYIYICGCIYVCVYVYMYVCVYVGR